MINLKSIKFMIKKLFSTGFFHLFGGNIINKAVVFLSGVVLIRVLSKTEYGTFTYAWNIYSCITLLSGMGIEPAVLQLSGEKGGNLEYTEGICNYGTAFGLRFNLFLTGILLVIGWFIPLKIPEGGPLLCALSLLPLFQFVFGMMPIFLRTQKKNKEYVVLTMVNTVLLFVLSVLGAIVLREIGVIIGYYASSILAALLGILVFHVNFFTKKRNVNDREKKELLKIGSISVATNAISQLLYLLDILVIGILDPQETVLADYKVATVIPTAMTFVPSSVMIYLYPYFAEHKNDGNWCLRNYKKIVLGLGIINLLIASVLFCFAPSILSFFFGKQYLDAVSIFRILAINYAISGTFRIISGNLLVTQRKLKFNLIESIFSSIVNIFADYFLIKYYGTIGAAMATVLVVIVSSFISTVYLIITFKKARHS